MDRRVLPFLCTLLVVSEALGGGTVDVVVAGYIGHGPMQPTVRAIREVLAKHGDAVTVTWMDLETEEGRTYFRLHGLSAHLNVIIGGSFEHSVDGRTVTFQWFEGQLWTKEDLDRVISGMVGGGEGEDARGPAQGPSRTDTDGHPGEAQGPPIGATVRPSSSDGSGSVTPTIILGLSGIVLMIGIAGSVLAARTRSGQDDEGS